MNRRSSRSRMSSSSWAVVRPAASIWPRRGRETQPRNGTRRRILESSSTSKTEISIRSPGPIGRSSSGGGGGSWLSSALMWVVVGPSWAPPAAASPGIGGGAAGELGTTAGAATEGLPGTAEGTATEGGPASRSTGAGSARDGALGAPGATSWATAVGGGGFDGGPWAPPQAVSARGSAPTRAARIRRPDRSSTGSERAKGAFAIASAGARWPRRRLRLLPRRHHPRCPHRSPLRRGTAPRRRPPPGAMRRPRCTRG